MTQQQFMSAIRTMIALGGGIAIGKGWLTSDQLTLLGSDATWSVIFQVAGVVGGLGAGLWGLASHSKTNTVAQVAAMPEVVKVEVAPTIAGRAILNAVGSAPDALITIQKK